jgi:hypothetical protein
MRTTVGEAIANGSVSELYIDAIAYSTDNGVSWIEIGQDLTGAYPEGLVTASRSGAGSSGEPSAQRPADPNTLSIEERLRQRRLQESGGGGGATIQVQMKDGVLVTPEGKPVQAIEGVRFERASGAAERSERGSDEPPERRGRGSDDPDDPDEPPPDDPDEPEEDPDRA